MNFTFSIISKDPYTIESINSISKLYENWHGLFVTSSYESAINEILVHTPDIVFLDLDHTQDTSSLFELLREMPSYMKTVPQIVGVSDFQEFAYQSIKAGFLDYIIKPYLELELRKVVLKYQKGQKEIPAGTLCLKSYSDYHFIKIDDINYLRADNNTTDIYLKSGKKITALKTLKCFEDCLPKKFIRIHNSYIINTTIVKRISFGKFKIYLAVDGNYENLPFSRSYRHNVKNLRELLMYNQLSA